MVEINWTFQAIQDLENIASYISSDSPRYAGIQINRFREKVKLLKFNPQIGRIVPEINNSKIHEIFSGNYRIIYQIISKNRVDILTIHHSAKLL